MSLVLYLQRFEFGPYLWKKISVGKTSLNKDLAQLEFNLVSVQNSYRTQTNCRERLPPKQV